MTTDDSSESSEISEAVKILSLVVLVLASTVVLSGVIPEYTSGISESEIGDTPMSGEISDEPRAVARVMEIDSGVVEVK